MDKYFGGVIWTNHALARLQERGIKQGDAFVAFQHPDSSRYAATERAYVYYKTWGNDRIEVVAAQNERKQWVILSVWSRPVFETGYKPKKQLPLLMRIIQKIVWGKF
jgi:hypothetical protein